MHRYSGLGIEGGIFGREIKCQSMRVVCVCVREKENRRNNQKQKVRWTHCLTHSQTDTRRNKQHPLSPLKITALRRTRGSQYIIQNKYNVRI